MEQGASKSHAENMLMSMFKLQQKSCLTDVTIVCKDGLLYGESFRHTKCKQKTLLSKADP